MLCRTVNDCGSHNVAGRGRTGGEALVGATHKGKIRKWRGWLAALLSSCFAVVLK